MQDSSLASLSSRKLSIPAGPGAAAQARVGATFSWFPPLPQPFPGALGVAFPFQAGAQGLRVRRVEFLFPNWDPV